MLSATYAANNPIMLSVVLLNVVAPLIIYVVPSDLYLSVMAKKVNLRCAIGHCGVPLCLSNLQILVWAFRSDFNATP